MKDHSRVIWPPIAASCLIVGLLSLTSTLKPVSAQSNTIISAAGSAQVEEIYLARSLRESRIKPTDFCVRAGADFNPLSEDVHSFRSVAIDSASGRITNVNVQQVGDLRSCNGKTAEPGVTGFYGEGKLAGVSFKGIGECRQLYSNFPEQGLSMLRCYLKFSGLSDEYAGGVLATSTMNSKNTLGLESDPPGYTQPSIATIRLWRKRAEK